MTPPVSPFEIVVVDNASADDSIQRLESNYDRIRLIRSLKNGGIAGGNNIGIQNSNGIYILLLNNDTIVLPGMIDRCVDFLNTHPDVGGVGGTMLNPDGSFQSSANRFPTLVEEFLQVTKLGLLISRGYPSLPPITNECEVDWITTAFMLFRREVLIQVGMVDEMFFIYSDETDLEYRIKKAGWKIFFLPYIKTIHFGGRSLTPWRSRALMFRGRLLFFRKHHSLQEEFLVRIMYLVASLCKIFFWIIVLVIPGYRKRAINELKSHYNILVLSLTPRFLAVN